MKYTANAYLLCIQNYNNTRSRNEKLQEEYNDEPTTRRRVVHD